MIQIYQGRSIIDVPAGSGGVIQTITAGPNEFLMISGVTQIASSGGAGAGMPLDGEVAVWIETSECRVDFASDYGRIASVAVLKPGQSGTLKYEISTWHLLNRAIIFIDKFAAVAY